MHLDFSFEGTKMRIIQSILASVVPVEYDPKVHIKPKGSNSKVSLIRAALEDSTEPNTLVFVISSPVILETFYDKTIKLWTSVHLDGSGNQVGVAGYGPSKAKAEDDWKYQNDHKGDQVVGALSVKIPSKKQAEILHLGSTLSGVGTILVNHCLKSLKKSGVKSVVLEAYSNTDASKFYEKFGFNRIDNTDTFTKDIK